MDKKELAGSTVVWLDNFTPAAEARVTFKETELMIQEVNVATRIGKEQYGSVARFFGVSHDCQVIGLMFTGGIHFQGINTLQPDRARGVKTFAARIEHTQDVESQYAELALKVGAAFAKEQSHPTRWLPERQ